MTPYELAYEYVCHTQRSLFLTGKAGTGKTTLLRRLRLECNKTMTVVAPTGVAAINAEGVTIHSLFQLPPQIFIPTEANRKLLLREMRMDDKKQRLLRSLELLIIDEVSMVRSDLLDTMDYVLRHFRRRRDVPFGGVQVLMIGDLYQLSPVVNSEDQQLMRTYYTGPYFFQSQVFTQLRPLYIELDTVFRQQDQRFVDVLNEVRNNCLSEASRQLLNSRYLPDWKQSKKEPFHITLSTHNRKVDEMNASELEALRGKTYTYKATIKDNYPESLYPMDKELTLRVGARVMFIKNDSGADKLYYNGKLGVVTNLSPQFIVVECTDTDGKPEKILVHQETWENIRYVTHEDSDAISTEVVGSFTQYPLRLAWAVTIHKAQGLTFEHVVIDAEDAFAAGQVYVALSRCRTLEGMVLRSPIPSGALRNAQDVLRFVAQQPDLKTIGAGLEDAQTDYFRRLMDGLFDFREAMIIEEKMHTFCREAGSFDLSEADSWFGDLSLRIWQLEDVGSKFRTQLRHILYAQTVDTEFLHQRMQAASGYFSVEIEKTLQMLDKAPMVTFDKADAANLDKRITELYTLLHRMRWMIEKMVEKPSVASYFRHKQQWKAPFRVQTSKGQKPKRSKKKDK